MPRHSALIPLSHDHHHILVLALRLKKRGPATLRDVWPTSVAEQVKNVLYIAEHDIRPHFRIEEELLFPAIVEGASQQRHRDLIRDLIEDHRAIEELLGRLISGSEATLGDTLYQLGILIEAHVRKEERGIFQYIHECVSPEQLADLQARIHEAHSAFRPPHHPF